MTGLRSSTMRRVWLGLLLIAVLLIGWTGWSSVQRAQGPQAADLPTLAFGEWRPVNVGSIDEPVWADYRIVSVATYAALSPPAGEATSGGSSSEREPSEGGEFAVVIAECRCPVSSDLRSPGLVVLDDAWREWTSDGVTVGIHAEFGEAAKALDIGDEADPDDAKGRVGDVQQLVDLFEVAEGAKGLEVIVPRVRLGDSGDGDTGQWVRWGTPG